MDSCYPSLTMHPSASELFANLSWNQLLPEAVTESMTFRPIPGAHLAGRNESEATVQPPSPTDLSPASIGIHELAR